MDIRLIPNSSAISAFERSRRRTSSTGTDGLPPRYLPSALTRAVPSEKVGRPRRVPKLVKGAPEAASAPEAEGKWARFHRFKVSPIPAPIPRAPRASTYQICGAAVDKDLEYIQL